MKEQIEFKATLDAKLAQALRKEVLTVFPDTDPNTIVDQDTLTVNYKFWIEYIGDIEKKFQALIKIIGTPGVAVDVDLQKVRQGESTLIKFFETYVRLKDAIVRKHA